MGGRGHAEGRRVTQRAGERGVGLLRRGVGNRPADQAFRLVLEDTGGRAVAVAQDLPARGGRRVAGDAGGLQRRRVGEALVPVEPVDPDGIIRRDGIDPVVPGERRAAPQRVVPVAAEDPIAGPEPGGVCLDAAHELLRGRGVAQVDRGELEPAPDEMGVAVREARRHETATGVDHLGGPADVARQRGAVPHRENRPAVDRHPAGLRVPGREARPDHPVGDEQVGFGAAGGEADGGHGGAGRTQGHTVFL